MTTDTLTRSTTGGFEDRFRVTRTDGKSINASRRYIVLDYAGNDPHAIVALKAYATSILEENPQMAFDVMRAIVSPSAFPSQHD
jgi:hypothetical protein